MCVSVVWCVFYSGGCVKHWCGKEKPRDSSWSFHCRTQPLIPLSLPQKWQAEWGEGAPWTPLEMPSNHTFIPCKSPPGVWESAGCLGWTANKHLRCMVPQGIILAIAEYFLLFWIRYLWSFCFCFFLLFQAFFSHFPPFSATFGFFRPFSNIFGWSIIVLASSDCTASGPLTTFVHCCHFWPLFFSIFGSFFWQLLDWCSYAKVFQDLTSRRCRAIKLLKKIAKPLRKICGLYLWPLWPLPLFVRGDTLLKIESYWEFAVWKSAQVPQAPWPWHSEPLTPTKVLVSPAVTCRVTILKAAAAESCRL